MQSLSRFLCLLALYSLLCGLLPGAHAQVPPATWRLADTTVGADNNTRLLWRNSDETICLWSTDSNGGLVSGSVTDYGPYAGWSASSIAAGSDGLSRLLWNRTDGAVGLWLMGANNLLQSTYLFGPYPGWTAVDLTVGGDNKARILWTNTSGQVSVWSVDNSGTPTYGPVYGPYPGFAARRIAAGSDGISRILWSKTNGITALWIIGQDNSYQASFGYGPYSGWTAVDLAVGADKKARLLWTNTSGSIAFWSVSNSGGFTSSNAYGPYTGYTASRIAAGADKITRVTWSNVDGAQALWRLDASNVLLASYGYGPFSGTGNPILIATGCACGVVLYWQGSPDQYQVFRSTSPGKETPLVLYSQGKPASPAQYVTTANRTFTDPLFKSPFNLVSNNGKPYYYQVKALNQPAAVAVSNESQAAAGGDLALTGAPPYNGRRVIFGGRAWEVKNTYNPDTGDYSDVYGPGGNHWSDRPENLNLSPVDGSLHIRITHRPAGGADPLWCCGELKSTEILGYGTYRFFLGSETDNFDPEIVFGMFSSFLNNNDLDEIDIEHSRFGHNPSTSNAVFVSQPYTDPTREYFINLPAAASSTQVIQWLNPNQLAFLSYYGDKERPTTSPYLPRNATYASWPLLPGQPPGQSPPPQPIPPQPDDPPSTVDYHAFLDLFLFRGNVPNNGQEQEVVVDQFDYFPPG